MVSQNLRTVLRLSVETRESRRSGALPNLYTCHGIFLNWVVGKQAFGQKSSHLFSCVHPRVRGERVPRRKLLVALRAAELELVAELDVLVPEAVGGEPAAAILALENLKIKAVTSMSNISC